jgi:tetratricopeptide (TPR) repeat protein
MNGFVTFLIVAGVFLLLKFIYDSYLTNNTNRRWNEYKRQDPETARKIENQHGVRDTKSDRERSMEIIARNTNSDVNSIKQEYFDELDKSNFDIVEYESTKKFLNEAKIVEAKRYILSHEDTPSAIIIEWTEEYWKQKAKTKNVSFNVTEEIIRQKLNSEMDMRDFKNAQKSIDTLILVNPTSEKYVKRGVIKQQQDNIQGAIQDGYAALEFDEIDPSAFTLLAEIYRSQNKFEKAYKYYKQGLNLIPENSSLLGDAGIFFQSIGCYYDAIVMCERSLELNPNNIDMYMDLIWIYFKYYPDHEKMIKYCRIVREKEKKGELMLTVEQESEINYIEVGYQLNIERGWK